MKTYWRVYQTTLALKISFFAINFNSGKLVPGLGIAPRSHVFQTRAVTALATLA